MAYRVEVRPNWPIALGEPGSEDWAPVFTDPTECEFQTLETARALYLVCLFAVRRLAFAENRELRIHEFTDEAV